MRMWQLVVTLPYNNRGWGKSKISVMEAYEIVKKLFTKTRAKWIGSGSSARAFDTQYAFRDKGAAEWMGKLVKAMLTKRNRKHEIEIYRDED